MKRSRLFPKVSGLQSQLSPCASSSPERSLTAPPSLSIEVPQHSHHVLRLASPSVPHTLLVHRPSNQHEKHDSNPIAW